MGSGARQGMHYCWRTPALTPQRLRRFARFFRVGAGWAARGRPTSPNTKEKTSRAAASSQRKGFASGITSVAETCPARMAAANCVVLEKTMSIVIASLSPMMISVGALID